MSIQIRDIPNYDELLEYVPKSNYMRNAVTQNRRITKLNSEQPLGGMPFQSNLEAVFRIAPSTSTLLNLPECYFSITGHMMRQAIDGETMVPSLKIGPLYLLKCINKITLQIGGCAVHTITTPALLAKLYEELAINHNDKERGALYEDGFYAKDSIDHYFGFSSEIDSEQQQYYIDSQTTDSIVLPGSYYNGDLTVATNTTASPPTSKQIGYVPFRAPVPPFNHITFEGLVNYASPQVPNSFPEELDIRGGTNAWSWMFKQNLKLKDIFPIEKLKPIFGQEVSVRIQFDSKGFTGILDSYGGSPLVYFFQQFYLNVYQYNINVEMINKLNQIYSKPVVEIIDSCDKQLQSIASISTNNEVQIFIPLQMQFETDYIAIYMPHNISNNANDGLILGKAAATVLPTDGTVILATDGLGGIMNYKGWKNFIEHTPMDHRFMNINRIQVECDGEILYQRTFNENPYKANMPMPYRNTAFSSLVTNLNPTTDITSFALTGVTTIPLNDYTNAYELYKECRCYWDVTEESAMPFQEWLYSGFAIIIPSSPFSRLTTGSNLTISINFGEGMTNTPTLQALSTVPASTDPNGGSQAIGINERISQTTATKIKTEVLNQICVVQKYKKALVFNGFNNCSIRTITQSFEQDIEVTESNDVKTEAN